MFLLNFIVFIFGLSVGSFINSIVYRLEKKESFLKGRSYCPKCKHGLSFEDLIPLFSFLFLRGECRYCKKKISLQYPLVELATGLLFVLVFSYQFTSFDFQNFLTIGYWLLMAGLLMIIFIYDLKHYIIPDTVIYSAIIISVAWLVLNVFLNDYSMSQFLNYLYSAVGAAVFFLAIVVISKGNWMGVGDIKLGFLMGLLLSFPKIIIALFFAFFSGAIIGLALIFLNKKTLKSEVPFGPFLIAGTFFSLFWGKNIANWYLSFLSY
ncbi:prepilin peptidase [Patescibacteria group bacterium]